jgi:DNA-binding response OmpR family regulator
MVPNVLPHVLVVEPYDDLRDGIVAALQQIAYSCDAVESAGDAVLKLHDRDYEYVVLDVAGTGALMADLVSSLATHRHLILITDGDPRDVRTGHAAVLRKPFAREELVAHFAH